ncbi:MAG TPA: preprotein translocase subunit SecE [Candidatus Saccharimonadales bacterium]|nr:preprotein translocase subunit SecE [Candidatus Saccharimonadales bacterium]
MATKAKKPAAKKETSQTKVTRITATDTKKVVTKKAPAKAETPAAVTPKTVKAKRPSTKPSLIKNLAAPFVALGVYFKGAWYELQQVTWPNRKATWSLTLALLVFTLFFAVMILLLDALFKYLFELILG